MHRHAIIGIAYLGITAPASACYATDVRVHLFRL